MLHWKKNISNCRVTNLGAKKSKNRYFLTVFGVLLK
jgi:hypothetical protein